MATRLVSAYVARVYTALVALAVGLAVAILAGGPLRFSGPGFAGARHILGWAPGPPYVAWGVVFGLYGLILLTALGRRNRSAVAALWAGVALYAFYAAGFLLSLGNPLVAGTGIITTGIFVYLHAITADRLSRGAA